MKLESTIILSVSGNWTYDQRKPFETYLWRSKPVSPNLIHPWLYTKSPPEENSRSILPIHRNQPIVPETKLKTYLASAIVTKLTPMKIFAKCGNKLRLKIKFPAIFTLEHFSIISRAKTLIEPPNLKGMKYKAHNSQNSIKLQGSLRVWWNGEGETGSKCKWSWEFMT